MFSYLYAIVPTLLLSRGLAAPLSEGSVSSRDIPNSILQPRAGTNFSVVATSQDNYNYGWMIPLRVGSQNFQVRMDTGSSTFWLLSNQLPPEQTSTGQTIYAPSSSASQVSGETYDGTYVDNSGSKGVVYADTVVVGPATVVSQAVGAATSVSAVRNNDPNSGMLGLSYGVNQNMSPSPLRTLSNMLMSQLTNPVIAMDLRNGADGSVDFGATDSRRYRGPIAYVPRQTSSRSSWNVPVSAAYVNGTLISGQPSVFALVDTGATLIRMPQPIVDRYYDSVPGRALQGGLFIFPCDNLRNRTMPSFGVQLGDRIATVPGEFMWYAPFNKTHCKGALQYASSGNTLGAMFLRTQYAVFNWTGPGYVGFAEKASLQEAPAPPSR